MTMIEIKDILVIIMITFREQSRNMHICTNYEFWCKFNLHQIKCIIQQLLETGAT